MFTKGDLVFNKDGSNGIVINANGESIDYLAPEDYKLYNSSSDELRYLWHCDDTYTQKMIDTYYTIASIRASYKNLQDINNYSEKLSKLQNMSKPQQATKAKKAKAKK